MFQKVRSYLTHQRVPEAGDPSRNVNCTEFEVDNWLISEFVVGRLVPIVGVHPFPLPELHLMVSAVCRLKPSVILEWGTHLGKSARVFWETVSHFRIETQIHSTDLPDEVFHGEHPGGERGKFVRGLGGVTLHQGDGLSTSLAVWEAGRRPPRPLFLVDGDHSYESVRRELQGISDSVPDASILLHDTFYQSDQSGYNVGPWLAIKDTLASSPARYRQLSTATGLPGMTLLYQL